MMVNFVYIIVTQEPRKKYLVCCHYHIKLPVCGLIISTITTGNTILFQKLIVLSRGWIWHK